MPAGVDAIPSINLIKAHALGNDFLLVSGRAVDRVRDVSGFARRVCHRHHGVGADGLMVLDESAFGARTRLFNADGSEAELSGNGLRTAAAWIARTRALQPGAAIVLETMAGPRTFDLLGSDGLRYTLRAHMGHPQSLRTDEIVVGEDTIPAVLLNMGNPQCVVLGPATVERLHTLGPAIATHAMFPAGTNVELATIERPDRVRILIWERGVGPTEASGTGACAAAVAAAFAGGAGRSIDVVSPGGVQHVEWSDQGVSLTGWAELVASVEWFTS
jgi:diaminopimelate epimerase